MADDKKATDDAVVKTPAKKAPAKEAAAVESAEKAAPKAKADPVASKPAKAPAKATTAKVAADEVSTGGTLKMHHLRPAPGAKTAKTRVGRGEASKGKTAGRGTKGQAARYQIPDRFEGGQMPLHMRLPKLRGFRNPFRVEFQVVNLETLSELYPNGGAVTVDDLVAKGAVRKGKLVKVLGTGEITVKLSVDVDAYSTSAKDKILAAGGSVAQD
jgi:large subunit ribosomal protein L15